MSPEEESGSLQSKSTHEENPKQDRLSGDQNTVQGGASHGGFIFQGGQHQIEVNQYFGAQPPTEGVDSPLTKESIATEDFEPETVLIPEGSFSIGSDAQDGIPDYEKPRREVFLPNYRIGKYPVTNAQYEQFIHETGRMVKPVLGWEGQRVPQGREQFPVNGVTWYEALAYCQWLKQKTGREYSLPNEAQWEKACRGGKYSLYPWGNGLDATRSNQGCDALAAVDTYPPQNDFGCFDFVGNVRQWTCTLWGEKRMAPDPAFAYPWKDDYRRNDLKANGQIRRVVRGSSFSDGPELLRCSARGGQLPEDVGFPGARHGFRVVMLILPNQR